MPGRTLPSSTPGAFRTRTLAELERLVGVVETAAPRLRDVVTERRIEAARNEVGRSMPGVAELGLLQMWSAAKWGVNVGSCRTDLPALSWMAAWSCIPAVRHGKE